MADTTHVFKKLTLAVSNAQAGQSISVQLTNDGPSIGFSTGPAFQNDAGIAVTSQSGTLPLQGFSINSSQANLQTTSSGGGGGGGSLVFQLVVWLVADPSIKSFYLRSTSSGVGVQVTAAIGNEQPRIVNATQTPFNWDPF